MAKAPTPATPEALTYEDGTSYDVRLMRPVKVAGIDFLPRHEHQMTGEFLNRLVAENGQDAIDAAAPVSV